jgi:hypothetical protein
MDSGHEVLLMGGLVYRLKNNQGALAGFYFLKK